MAAKSRTAQKADIDSAIRTNGSGLIQAPVLNTVLKQMVDSADSIVDDHTTAKSSVVDADRAAIFDSAASNAAKYALWSTVATYIGTKLGAVINALTGKTTPTGADVLVIGDSAASWASKSLSLTNLKAWLFASPAFTGTQYTYTTSDDLNDFGPLLIFDRISASPAAADGLMRWLIRGRDSGGNAHNYIDFQAYIDDPTNGSEDGKIVFSTSAAGTLTTTLTLASGITTAASLVATTADINGGTVDGVTIGGSSRGAGHFSQLTIDDATFLLDIQSSVPILAFDTNDYFGYDRSGNSFAWTIGGTQAAALAATGLNVTAAINAATVAGSMVASQADMEAGTGTDKIVTPGRQNFHPSAAKAWVKFDASSGTPTIRSSYNITSLTDDGVGLTTVTIATDLSSANNCVPTVSAGTSGSNQVAHLIGSGSVTAGTFAIATCVCHTAALTDCSVVTGIVFGDM